MRNSDNNSAGLWMVFGLVVLLALPLVIDHFVHLPTTDTSLQAEALTN